MHSLACSCRLGGLALTSVVTRADSAQLRHSAAQSAQSTAAAQVQCKGQSGVQRRKHRADAMPWCTWRWVAYWPMRPITHVFAWLVMVGAMNPESSMPQGPGVIDWMITPHTQSFCHTKQCFTIYRHFNSFLTLLLRMRSSYP